MWDETLKGFGCMVTDKGAKSYLIQYRIGGRGSPTRRVTIGRHGSPWTAERARDRAAELLEQVRRKIDPFQAEREAVETARALIADRERTSAAAAKLAFGIIADGYIEQAKKSLRRWREQEAIIDRDLKPSFGNTPLPDISADDINDQLAKVAERSHSASLKAYVALRAIYAHAHGAHRKLFPKSLSPFEEVVRPEGGGKRNRHLSRNETRLMWVASKVLGWPFGPIYQLLLVTGMRLREVAEGRWSEIDLEEKRWLLPGERTKNGEPHFVHLSPPAVAIIKEMPHIKCEDGADFIFTTNSKTAVSGFSRAKARLNAAMAKINAEEAEDKGLEPQAIKPFVIHDTRRTFARGCQKGGTPPEVVERLLGHVSDVKSGLKGTYQTYEFEPERIEAMNKWADSLLSIANGGARVVMLREAS